MVSATRAQTLGLIISTEDAKWPDNHYLMITAI